MYEVGDAVLCGTEVGIVISEDSETVLCSTSSASDKKFPVADCMLVAKYNLLLEQFERSILNACR